MTIDRTNSHDFVLLNSGPQGVQDLVPAEEGLQHIVLDQHGSCPVEASLDLVDLKETVMTS